MLVKLPAILTDLLETYGNGVMIEKEINLFGLQEC